jgi:hypothetical protein
MSKAPAPRTLALPEVTHFKRVGRIRLGEAVDTVKNGKTIALPKKVDYLRVDPDDEITLPEAAASYLAEYGPEPKRIKVRLPGKAPEDNLRGGWRKYGTSKLLCQCDGNLADERSETGGWVTGQCFCQARGIPETDKRNHCAWVFALELVLPDVKTIGIWDIATSSQVSVNRLTTSMVTFFEIFGDLRGRDYVLEMFPVKVSPDGRTQTIYAVDLSIVDKSQAELVAGLPLLPPPVAGVIPPPAIDTPDALLHSPALQLASSSTVAGAAPGGRPEPNPGTRTAREGVAAAPATTTEGGAESGTGAPQSGDAAPTEPLWQAVERQIDALTPHQSKVVAEFCKANDIKPTRDGFIEAWGEQARDIAKCIGAAT